MSRTKKYAGPRCGECSACKDRSPRRDLPCAKFVRPARKFTTVTLGLSGLPGPSPLPPLEAEPRYVRFTLPDGEFVDIEAFCRDGVYGLSVRGSESLDLKLNTSNALWLVPANRKAVP